MPQYADDAPSGAHARGASDRQLFLRFVEEPLGRAPCRRWWQMPRSGSVPPVASPRREQLDAGRFTYYGRVVRDGGYLCLQYWYFYAMNDWRSTCAGINDHEADWEMVTIYLTERGDGTSAPGLGAFSSHDYRGDDLRRRWDDPELRREGPHPVLQPALRFARKVQRLLAPWRHYTGGSPGLGIAFVDYARGDGTVIGAGHDHQ